MNNFMTDGEATQFNNLLPGTQDFLLGSKLKYLFDISGGTGNIFYLDPTNGNDGKDGKSTKTAFASLAYAYTQLTANQNDILFYMAGTTGTYLSSTLTWAKDYTHFIGISAPVTVANRARIFQTATATAISPMVDITATGCIFKNLYSFQGVADATSKINVRVTGQRNYFEDVHFAGIGNTIQDVSGSCSLKIDGGGENVFKRCAIGLDTISRGANSTELWFTNSATRNIFENCQIYAYISAAGHSLVKVDPLGIDRYTRFKDCLFLTDSLNQAITCTSIFSMPAMKQGKIILDLNTRMVTDGASGSGAWDSNSRGLIWNAGTSPAAAAAGGICTKV